MNKGVVLTVSISAVLAAVMLTTVPMASAVQQASRLATLMHPDASSKTETLSPALARIRSGETTCIHCDLHGADLSHEQVKSGNLTGSNLANARATYMSLTLTNLTDVSFKHANLTGANLDHANLANADLTDAKLGFASIKDANLSTARGLTQGQLDNACADAKTKLPQGLHPVVCS